MRFKGLDLNLLVVFEALMDVRSATRVAERLGITQPAVSAALRRLRQFFGDDIFVLEGKRMHPTPFAEMLLPEVQESLRGIERAIETPARFDPATSSRTFKIFASDYIMIGLLAPLAERLSAHAPNIRLDLVQPDAHPPEDFDHGRIDLLMAPESFLTPWRMSELLFEEEQVVVGWADNPVFRSVLSEDDFYEAGHVAIAFGAGRRLAFADGHLQQRPRPRRVDIVVSSFAAAPWFLLRSNRLAVMHVRMARAFMAQFDLACAPMPFEFPRMRTAMQCQQARELDPGLSWLRQEILSLARATQI